MWHAAAMSGFDAELYLRLAGERSLLGGSWRNRGPRDSPLTEAARALVAIGAIATDGAQSLIDDYELAIALRGEGMRHHLQMRGHRHASSQAAATPLEQRRVVLCDGVIEQPTGTLRVRHASLSASSTRIAVTLHPADRQAGRARRGRGGIMMRMRGGGPGGSGPRSVKLGDDRGTTVTAPFSGSGSGGEWQGHLTADQPLAEDTRWIEVDGARIELVDAQPHIEVSVQELENDQPALRHLWHCAATPGRFMGAPDMLEPAIDALVAAGALSAEDPALGDVRSVVASLQHGNRSMTAATRRLPEPWRSLLSRSGVQAGPAGTILIGAVTPPFDGVSVAVMSLEATEEGFELEVEETPGLGGGMPFDSGLQQRTLAWWAADDRGNHYLGHLGSWSGGDGHAAGTVQFWPVLDPKATRLEVMPSTDRARAVIRVPLAWTRSTGEDA